MLRDGLAICGQLQNLKAPAIDAVGVPDSLASVQTGALSGIFQGMRVHARLEHLEPTPVYLGKGARERRRDGADQVVYGACAASPIDASVLGASPAKIGSDF